MKSKTLKKKGKGIKSTSFIISLAIVLAIFLIWAKLGFPIGFQGLATSEENDSFSNPFFLHYTHLPVTYNISDTCGVFQGDRVRWAFLVFSNETNKLINFTEVNGTADITANCWKDTPDGQISNTYIAGDGVYYRKGTKITRGILNFYNVNSLRGTYDGGCMGYPDTELHEILHTFGFEHTKSKKSIMNPALETCQVRRIDPLIIQKLKRTYRIKR